MRKRLTLKNRVAFEKYKVVYKFFSSEVSIGAEQYKPRASFIQLRQPEEMNVSFICIEENLNFPPKNKKKLTKELSKIPTTFH